MASSPARSPRLHAFPLRVRGRKLQDPPLLSQEEYADARTRPNWFILAPGHEFRSGIIRSSMDRFVLVEKHGLAKEIAERDATP
jgi:hypothetical protein